MKLVGKTVLITGGTSGIGLELATRLLGRGNTVIVTGRDQDRLRAAQAAVPGLQIQRSDVSDPHEIAALHERLMAQFPLLDVLVNNAGIMRNLDLRSGRDLADVTREIDVNLSGPVRMVQQFLPHLMGRPESLIVSVSSGLAFVPMPISPVYCAAKAALHAYTRSLRVQLEGTTVAVVELAPPAVETQLLRAEFAVEMKGRRAMDVGVLAKRAIAGIEAGRLEIRPGQSNALKILSRIAPNFIFKQLTRMGRPAPAAA